MQISVVKLHEISNIMYKVLEKQNSQMWRIIVQVCAFYMQKNESIHFLPFFLVALYDWETSVSYRLPHVDLPVRNVATHTRMFKRKRNRKVTVRTTVFTRDHRTDCRIPGRRMSASSSSEFEFEAVILSNVRARLSATFRGASIYQKSKLSCFVHQLRLVTVNDVLDLYSTAVK